MTDSRWKNLALEVIGCFVSALGLYSFAVAAGVPVTGVAGIGAILFRLFGLPIGVTNIIMNIPIVLICFKYLGKDFFFRSVRCMVLFAIFTDYVLAALPVYQGDRMLATICGGVISGVGDALIYMQNSSTGGLDFITMAIKSRHPHMPFGNLTFAAALAVILANGLVFHDVDSIIYGLIFNFLSSYIINRMMFGFNACMMALIVTSDGFLSTLSLRRATGLPTVPGVPGQHFYPRSPCGERRCYFLHFSALLQFLSTLSLRRATGFNQPQRRLYAISIHALLAESDWLLHRVHTQRRNFYPRSPCGERLQAGCFRINYNISIHALLAESDLLTLLT